MEYQGNVAALGSSGLNAVDQDVNRISFVQPMVF